MLQGQFKEALGLVKPLCIMHTIFWFCDATIKTLLLPW